MNRLVSDKLWKELGKIAKGKRRTAAIAYVTSDKYVKFRKNDLLITDASDRAIRCGETSAKVLSAAYKRKAAIYSFEGLHAKILICGRTAAVGSANMSASSDVLVEATVITDDPIVVAQSTAFVDRLTGLAKPVDDEFLKRILAIKVLRKGGRARPRRRVRLETRGGRAWIVGVQELADDAHPDEAERAETGEKKARARRSSLRNDITWIRWVGKDRFIKLADEGDAVIQIWRPLKGKRPVVYRHCPIIYRQVEPTCVRFYLEEYPDSADDSLTIGEFRKLVETAGVAGKVGPTSGREIGADALVVIEKLWPRK